MPSVDVIYIITTRQFVRPCRGIDRYGVDLDSNKSELPPCNIINNYYITL